MGKGRKRGGGNPNSPKGRGIYPGPNNLNKCSFSFPTTAHFPPRIHFLYSFLHFRSKKRGKEQRANEKKKEENKHHDAVSHMRGKRNRENTVSLSHAAPPFPFLLSLSMRIENVPCSRKRMYSTLCETVRRSKTKILGTKNPHAFTVTTSTIFPPPLLFTEPPPYFLDHKGRRRREREKKRRYACVCVL